MKRFLLITLLSSCFMLSTWGQEEADYVSDNDGERTTSGIWTGIEATKVLPYNFSINLDAGLRTSDGVKEADRFDIGLGLNWKPGKHWKFGIGYTYINKYYISETEHKSVNEREYNYRNTSNGNDVQYTTFPGATYDAIADNASYTDEGTVFRYQGYSDTDKNYTRITNDYWRAKHRISLDATYTHKFWKYLRISLRERYQLTFVPSKSLDRTRTGSKTKTDYTAPVYDALTPADITALAIGDLNAWEKITYDDKEGPNTTDAGKVTEKAKNDKTLHILRSRFTFEIDKKGWDCTPYAYFESFNNLGEQWHFDKIRASVGIDYSLSKQHKVGIGYIFNHENDDDGDLNIHAISVDYKFKF